MVTFVQLIMVPALRNLFVYLTSNFTSEINRKNIAQKS